MITIGSFNGEASVNFLNEKKCIFCNKQCLCVMFQAITNSVQNLIVSPGQNFKHLSNQD